MNPSRRISGLLAVVAAFCCLITGIRAQFQTPSPEIVSAWKHNTEDVVIVFGYDGTYYLIQGDPADPGMERGTFSWDKETQDFSVITIVDTNGEGGLSHPNGATTLSITGNTLNYTVAGEAVPATFTRVVNPASAIVGTWTTPGENFSITFLADPDLSYYHAQVQGDVPFGYTGMERGTYTWNPTTKAFTVSTSIDTNGEGGLGEVAAGATVSVTGNTLVFTEGLQISTLTRVTTNPTPLRLPDFGTVRFAEYFQTSNSAPALKPFNVVQETSPYSVEAFVDPAVGATAPTVKIGNGALIVLDADPDDPADFYIEQGYATLAELNTILPASTAIQFKNGTTSTANLITGASPLTFPSIPKINVGTGASWSGGLYQFGDNEVLQWTLPTGFVASQYVTVLNVFDPATFQDVVDAEIQGEVTFYDLGGKLEPGRQYEVELDFYRIDTSTTAGSGVFSGKQGYTLSASSTNFNVRSRNVFPESPFINEQPVHQPGTTGAPLILTVGINEGAFPFSTFQWFKNNQEIPGQTGNSLYIPSFDLDDHSGRYTVLASNDEGVAVSNTANVGNVGTVSRAVDILEVKKRIIAQQQSATLIAPPAPTFNATVQGEGITATFPSSTITLTRPDNSSFPLVFDEDHWDAGEIAFPSLVALQAAFPNGVYKINIASDAIPINMSASNFPNQPLITSSVGTWVSGKLRITASQAAAGFSLTSNSSTGDSTIRLSVFDSQFNDIVNQKVEPATGNRTVTAVVPAGGLVVGQSYTAEAEFNEIIDYSELMNKSWGLPPNGRVEAFGFISSETFLTIEVVADPVGSPYDTWKSGVFTSTQLANPAISGDDADFDNDGIETIFEFILGGIPTTPNPNLLKNATTTPATVGRNLVFFYDRKTVANGIAQVIETSPTLTGTWTPAVNGVAGVVISTTPLDGSTERVTATIPSTETKLFVRLKATR